MTPYYEHAGITIYHADCRDVLSQVPPVQLLLTDPPYGINLGKHASATLNGIGTHGHLGKRGYDSYEDTVENFLSIVVPVINAVLPKVIRGVVFCAGRHVNEFPKPTEIGGIYFPAAIGICRWGFNSVAPALLYGPGCNTHLGAKPTIYVSYDGPPNNGHPCPKPLPAIKHFVNLGSSEGDWIIDPFMGSGTTLRAAKDMGRCAIGIEIEERYCEIAAKRLSQEVLPFELPQSANGIEFQSTLDYPEERQHKEST